MGSIFLMGLHVGAVAIGYLGVGKLLERYHMTGSSSGSVSKTRKPRRGGLHHDRSSQFDSKWYE